MSPCKGCGQNRVQIVHTPPLMINGKPAPCERCMRLRRIALVTLAALTLWLGGAWHYGAFQCGNCAAHQRVAGVGR